MLVLCDPRLLTKSYGRVFLDSLPPMPRTRKLERVRAFSRVAMIRSQDRPWVTGSGTGDFAPPLFQPERQRQRAAAGDQQAEQPSKIFGEVGEEQRVDLDDQEGRAVAGQHPHRQPRAQPDQRYIQARPQQVEQPQFGGAAQMPAMAFQIEIAEQRQQPQRHFGEEQPPDNQILKNPR